MITTVHKIDISFRPPDGTDMAELFRGALDKLPDGLNMTEWEYFYGNPACFPYMACESSNLSHAKMINRILYRYLDFDCDCKVDV